MQLCDENQFLTGRRNSTKKACGKAKCCALENKPFHKAALSRRGTILFFK